jgi:DNA-binding NarL/FixJ family response regulator
LPEPPAFKTNSRATSTGSSGCNCPSAVHAGVPSSYGKSVMLTPQNEVSPMSIKVLLADDSEIVRRAIRQLLATQTEIEIVGESSDFVQTIQMTKDLDPRVVILDLHMPDENQITPQDVKSQLNHGVQVLAISFSNDDDAKDLAKNLGAAVLLDKMALAHTLIPTIMQLSRKSRAAA